MSRFGFVVECTIPRKVDGIEGRGFAFITFGHKEEAELAMKSLNGQKVKELKRLIAVDWALPKKEFELLEKSQHPIVDEDSTSNVFTANDDETGSQISGEASLKDDESTYSVSGDDIKVTYNESSDDGSEYSDENDSANGGDDEHCHKASKKKTEDFEPAFQDAQDGSTLFVRNLAFETTQEELREK